MAKNNMENGYKYMYLVTAAVCIIIAAIIALVLIFGNLFSDDKNTSSTSSVSKSQSEPDDSASQAGAINNVVSVDVSDYVQQSVQNSTLPDGILSVIKTTSPDKAKLNVTDIYSRKLKIYSLSTTELYLNADAITALNKMMQDFNNAEGLSNISVNDAYTALTAIKAKKSIADLADLASGRTVRLIVYPQGEGTMGSGKYQWFTDNCHKYGFILRYPADKTDKTGVEANASVFRYVGTAHAGYMKENNLCLEEYVEFLKTYDYKKPLTYTDKETSVQYYIYYQKAAVGDVTPVFVPNNKSCDISGNNIDGFVITVASSSNK